MLCSDRGTLYLQDGSRDRDNKGGDGRIRVELLEPRDAKHL